MDGKYNAKPPAQMDGEYNPVHPIVVCPTPMKIHVWPKNPHVYDTTRTRVQTKCKLENNESEPLANGAEGADAERSAKKETIPFDIANTIHQSRWKWVDNMGVSWNSK